MSYPRQSAGVTSPESPKHAGDVSDGIDGELTKISGHLNFAVLP
jgi:hypothetical protein